MKRGFIVLFSLCAIMTLAYFTASKWAIHHKTLTFDDPLRGDRNVTVDLAVRRDREMESIADMIDLPVAILSHGNTVKNTEYSFLANSLAARGYMVVSIQHDLATDDPMVTRVGEEYVGRRMQYNRGIGNIMFAIDELKKVYPNADYHHLTLVGHSNGGDISMYFAKLHPDMVKKVVTLDNLRVPFITDGKVKILSFRSRDPVFKADPGVVPDDEVCAKAGIEVVHTQFQHNDLSDRGPDQVKALIATKVHQFLDEVDQDDDNPFKLLPTTSADAGVVTETKPAAPVTSPAAPVAAVAPVASAKN
ncbi:MAG TPA: alpha/beta hydrolase [Bradyrhizobium sp.]|nr:alpha/beta hydrolase [Bradyrhizobium sp.]